MGDSGRVAGDQLFVVLARVTFQKAPGIDRVLRLWNRSWTENGIYSVKNVKACDGDAYASGTLVRRTRGGHRDVILKEPAERWSTMKAPDSPLAAL